MKAGLLSLIGVTAACQAFAQIPVLEPPVALDVRVTEVRWQPHGNGLLYVRDEAKGFGIGGFAPGCKDGKVLLHLGEGDDWEAQWFESAPSAIVNVYRKVQTEKGEARDVEVWLLDAKAQRATRLYSARSAPGQIVEVNVDTSPSMIHAICRITIGKEKHNFVLPNMGKSLLASLDLDRAEQESFNGPVWSIDGTAVYSKGGAAGDFFASADNVEVKQAKDAGTSLALTLERGSGKFALSDLPLLKFVFARPAPPVGSSVLELMPGSTLLRPVKFRGEWQPVNMDVAPLGTLANPSRVEFGISKGEAHSLWLTRGEPRPNSGVLIAAHSQQAWLAPENKAVAYTTDGALFVRLIGAKRD